MTTVVRSYPACDGHNVRVTIADELHILHFPAEPTQQQFDDAVASVERRLLFEEEAAIVEETEDGV